MCKNEQGSKGKNQLLIRIHLLRDAHMSKDPIAFSEITDEKAMQSTVSSMKVAMPTSMAFVGRFHAAPTMMNTGYVVHGGEYLRGQPRETTLLQSLPWPLPGSVTAKHVGSVVPPPLANAAVAERLVNV